MRSGKSLIAYYMNANQCLNKNSSIIKYDRKSTFECLGSKLAIRSFSCLKYIIVIPLRQWNIHLAVDFWLGFFFWSGKCWLVCCSLFLILCSRALSSRSLLFVPVFSRISTYHATHNNLSIIQPITFHLIYHFKYGYGDA